MLFSAIETFDSAILFSFRFLDSFFVITNFALVVFIILCFFIFEIFLIDIKFLSISFFIRNYFFYGFNKIINVVYIVVKSQLMKNYKHAYFLMFSTIFLQIMFSNLFGIFIGFSVSSLLIFTFYLSSLV